MAPAITLTAVKKMQRTAPAKTRGSDVHGPDDHADGREENAEDSAGENARITLRADYTAHGPAIQY
jgi:hypothetical protein